LALRPYLLTETNYRLLQDNLPQVAVLPWGATEAHNYHLPYGTDSIQATHLAQLATEKAIARDAKVIVLPTVPFGNDSQQLDQIATISICTNTAAAVLRDIAKSLVAQGIDRLVLVNSHGGNQFQPLVRDLEAELPILIVVVNFYEMIPQFRDEIFSHPGDHAGELETSLMQHLRPDLVETENARPGDRVPFAIEALKQPGVWTPRPWSRSHPDTGSGNPSEATAEKGRKYFDALTNAIADVLVDLSSAEKGDLPY